eukprot:TRINITY_DN32263_c0_g1_i1.p1 TRINITY_DN32263_c0_g1~~TRINITY_DN32263_c0_g1_i1.p1  ORF type:complete len:1384 (+),score=467.66 TRINITY_DN32263_c0_g1_i1:447-4154(+)
MVYPGAGAAYAVTAPRVATASPVRATASLSNATEVAVLQERVANLQVEHAHQMRVHEQNLQAKADQEVAGRTAQYVALIDRMKLDAIKQREDSHRRINELQADLERVRDVAKRNEMDQREAFLAKEREILNSAQAQMEEESRAMLGKARSIQGELDRSTMAADELQAELHRKDHSLSLAHETITDMKQQHTKAMEALEVLTSKHQAVANEAMRTASSVALVSESRDQLAMEFSELQQSYEQQAQTLKQTRDEAEKRRNAHDALQVELSALRRQVADMQTTCEQRAEDINQLTLERNTLSRKVDEVTTRAERQVKQKERDVEALCDEKVAMMTAEVKAKTARITELQARYDEAREYKDMHAEANLKLKSAAGRVAELESLVKEKERDIESRMDRAKYVEEMTLKLHSSELRELALEERLRDAQTQLSEKEREVLCLQNKVSNAEDVRMQHSAAEARVAALGEREKDVNEQLRQKKVELNAANEKIRNLDEIRVRLREETATLRAQNDSFRDREEQSKVRDTELGICKDEMNRAALELNRRAEEIKALKAQTEEVLTLREQCAKSGEVRDMLAAKDERLDVLARELATLQVEYTRRGQQYDDVLAELEGKEKELAQQQAVLAAAEEDVRQLVRTREELDVAKADAEEVRLHLTQREATLGARAAELTAGCEELMAAQQRLTTENASMRDELDEAVRRNEHLATMLEHKDVLLRQNASGGEAGESKLAELRAWVEQKTDDAAAEVARMERERDDAADKARRAQGELDRVSEERTAQQRIINNLKTEVEQNQIHARAKPPGEEAMRAVRTENESLKKLLAGLQKQLREQNDERVAFEEKIIALSQDLSSAKDANGRLTDANMNLRKAANNSGSPAQHTADQFLIDSLQAKYDNLKSEHTAMNEALCQKTREIKSLKASFDFPAMLSPHAAQQQPSWSEQPLDAPAPANYANVTASLATLGNAAESDDMTPADIPLLREETDPMHARRAPRRSMDEIDISEGGTEANEGDAPKKTVMGVRLDDGETHEEAVRITDVKMGGPAYQAGMRKGDFLKALGRRRASSAELARLLAASEPQDRVEVVFLRVKNGKATEFVQDVKLAAPPKPQGLRRQASGVGIGLRSESGHLRTQDLAPASPTRVRQTTLKTRGRALSAANRHHDPIKRQRQNASAMSMSAAVDAPRGGKRQDSGAPNSPVVPTIRRVNSTHRPASPHAPIRRTPSSLGVRRTGSGVKGGDDQWQ